MSVEHTTAAIVKQICKDISRTRKCTPPRVPSHSKPPTDQEDQRRNADDVDADERQEIGRVLLHHAVHEQVTREQIARRQHQQENVAAWKTAGENGGQGKGRETQVLAYT